MVRDVVSVMPLDGHRLQLRFDDGVEGVYDASTLEFAGVFEPLRSPEYFALARLDAELGTVVWPNGADLDPMVLYSSITGRPALSVLVHRQVG